MEYQFRENEKKWQARWSLEKTFKSNNHSQKPSFYILDMFPYPSGAGLHVGHPLGYIASDILARYKRARGYEVLHPMGYDSFGLPAEQYAIQTGQHPAVTTRENINRYREQLDKIGFSFDWSREVRTSEPSYYKWTQWIFTLLFNSWYNIKSGKAEPIDQLIAQLETEGNVNINAAGEASEMISASQWNSLTEKEKSDLLLKYRLAYQSDTMVNWCPQLGTVLANEEVKDGLSERGGYPVERKLMKQWSLRISAYADRLLEDLDDLDWTESMKEAQRNWIGKSEGTSINFVTDDGQHQVEVFTTRPDTIFGVSFVTIAPEHELVPALTTIQQQDEVDAYIEQVKNKSDRERLSDVRKISGVFTGSYVLHPFNGLKIPVWVGDYVLAGYGTGAVMAVPAHDSRDYAFATHFNLDKPCVIVPPTEHDFNQMSYDEKAGTLINSDFLNGLSVPEAIRKAIDKIEAAGKGKGTVQYRLRDAIFGRQRYWGEPIPVYYREGIAQVLPEADLPLLLPEVDKYLPTASGEPPLARAMNWKYKGQFDYEWSTMPGWAGSSWYYLRYMDPDNETAFASPEALKYWKAVDIYIGGAEHATGHLLYIRFWTKFLFDLGYLQISEPAKKLINQGMIQGVSCLVYRVNGQHKIVSHGLRNNYETTALHIDVSLVDGNKVNIEKLKVWRSEFADAVFELENGELICGTAVEKMSKRWYNVVNPDDICEQFGADCLRMYEMFLGPLELSKPWSTSGINGVSNFLRKFWRLFYQHNQWVVEDIPAEKAELKVLHKTIKKITEDIERFSFNTAVSGFMICVNELHELKCTKREILEPLCILLAPFAPHIAEEIWEKLGHSGGISYVPYPVYNEAFLAEDEMAYPVSVNGKKRFDIRFSTSLTADELSLAIMERHEVIQLLDGKSPKKIIVVPKKIINIVV